MLWHYTTGQKWLMIELDGLIKLCDGPLQKRSMDRPVAWFSTNPEYEPSAYKYASRPDGERYRLTYEQMHTFAGGTFRISVDPGAAPHNWPAFCNMSGIHREEAMGLARLGRYWGANPDHWFVSFEPVPRDRWLMVEHDETGRGGWAPIWTKEGP